MNERKKKYYIFEIFCLVMYLPLKLKGLYHILHDQPTLERSGHVLPTYIACVYVLDSAYTSNIDFDLMYLL